MKKEVTLQKYQNKWHIILDKHNVKILEKDDKVTEGI